MLNENQDGADRHKDDANKYDINKYLSFEVPEPEKEPEKSSDEPSTPIKISSYFTTDNAATGDNDVIIETITKESLPPVHEEPTEYMRPYPSPEPIESDSDSEFTDAEISDNEKDRKLKKGEKFLKYSPVFLTENFVNIQKLKTIQNEYIVTNLAIYFLS